MRVGGEKIVCFGWMGGWIDRWMDGWIGSIGEILVDVISRY